MSAFVPVILSGGAGTRLWPVSREALPKPFIKLPDGESLLQKTLKRAAALPDVAEILTVTNRDHFFLTRDEYGMADGLPPLDYLLEPCGRNTAPAIAAATLQAAARCGADAVLLVLPADHLIGDQAAFAAAVAQARQLAAEGWLVTFGVRPSAPETGFGYIEAGAAIGTAGYRVERFVEKPSREKAEAYLAAGSFTWNSGMFCFAAGTMLDALRAHAGELEGVPAADHAGEFERRARLQGVRGPGFDGARAGDEQVCADKARAFVVHGACDAIAKETGGGDAAHADHQREQQHTPFAAGAFAGEQPQGQTQESHATADSAMRPATKCRRRGQRVASAGSWVTRISVVPAEAFSSNNRLMMRAPVSKSRFPVGSSANTISGSAAKARAMATRCCSPPESWRGV